jgi:hypothetical protein
MPRANYNHDDSQCDGSFTVWDGGCGSDLRMRCYERHELKVTVLGKMVPKIENLTHTAKHAPACVKLRVAGRGDATATTEIDSPIPILILNGVVFGSPRGRLN